MNLGASAISSPQGTGEVSPALLPLGPPDPGPLLAEACDWGCTCHPLSCCSQRLLPGPTRLYHGSLPGPWHPYSPAGGWKPPAVPHCYHGYQATGRWGETLLHIPPSRPPVGFGQNLPALGEEGMRAQPDTQALCVCVCVCGSAVAIMLAEQLRAPKGIMDRGQGWGPPGTCQLPFPILDS